MIQRSYDAAGRLTEQQTDGFQHLAWTYTADGNITALDDLANSNQSQSFGYDALHRLTGADAAYRTGISLRARAWMRIGCW